MKKLDNVFPLWGPYGKKYMGISRVVDEDMLEGIRFDFTTAPAIFGSGMRVPNTTVPCGCRAWQCNEDYTFYSYRFDLEGKDDAYSIVSYVKLSDESTLVRTEIFNNTSLIQNCLVNYFSSIEYRFDRYVELSLPEKCFFIKATDYESYDYAITRPWDQQNADARIKGEFADNNFYMGKGLGDRAEKWHMPHRYLAPFGGEKGDRVSYKLNCKEEFNNPVLVIRYRTSDIRYLQGKQVGVNYINSDKDSLFVLNGEKEVLFKKADDPAYIYVPMESVPEKLEFVAQGTGGVEIDFIAVTEKEDADKVKTQTKLHEFKPEIEIEKCDKGYKSYLKYADAPGKYILRTFDDNTRYRTINTGCLEDCMSARLSNSDETYDDLTESFTNSFKEKHSDNGFFHNAIVHTLFIKPGESKVVYSVISKDEEEYKTCDEYEEIYQTRAKEFKKLTFNDFGKKYELSNELLKSAVLTNVVYPIYKHGRYIIHHTPGKRWDCLYTWDSGFIGLGFSGYAPKLSEFILDTYLSDENNKDYAFVHHGSPVPVQFYIFFELMNKNGGKEIAAKYYDRLKLYYDFYLGKIRGSTTAKFKSGLLTTYDYFYSSSGMDDYPAQVAMMKENLRDTAAPVITTSQAIRCAKIMIMASKLTGREDDEKVYRQDIAKLKTALNTYSWDDESGYYSYVLHDKDYNPVEKYVNAQGENVNKGLDGIYPIIAGVCDENQKEKILAHLKSEKNMLSPYGISAVDVSASYFKVNGYWNGNIWFSHQWFLFKTMLDLGEVDFAYEIARMALDIWKRECEYNYYTFEMVSVVTGRGGWFHNFGGLSTPINMWATTYFKPGTITTGFDMLVEKCEFNEDNTGVSLKLTNSSDNPSYVVVCLDDKYDYSVVKDGTEIECKERFKGEVEIQVNGTVIIDIGRK